MGQVVIAWRPVSTCARDRITNRLYAERTVKLWKLNERYNEVKSMKADVNGNERLTSSDLRLPVRRSVDQPSISITLRRQFTNGHEYSINSVSVNSDLQTFLTADDLRVNVWNLEVSTETYSMLLPVIGSSEYTIATPHWALHCARYMQILCHSSVTFSRAFNRSFWQSEAISTWEATWHKQVRQFFVLCL